LLYLANRQRDAERELTAAVAAADKSGSRVVGYLGRLMLGRLAAFRGRDDEAIQWFARALEVDPTWTAGRIGVAVGLLATGRPSEAWQAARRVFGEPGRPMRLAADPWAYYPAEHWRHEERLAGLRAMVAARPSRERTDERTGVALRTDSEIPTESARGGRAPTGFRADVEAVRVDVLVTDGGRPVPGLSPLNFELRDNGVLQSVQSTTTVDSLSVAVVLDRTVASAAAPHLRRSAESALRALRPADRASIVEVSDVVELVRHAVVGRSGEPFVLREPRKPSPRTVLWDGVLAAASLTPAAAGRPVVLIASDGGDNASWCDRSCATASLPRTGITVDAIAFSHAYRASAGWSYGDMAFGSLGVRAFEDVTRATGGVIFQAEDPDLPGKIGDRLSALRAGYVLWYTPRGVKKDDGWHKIEVRLKGAQGRVMARPGYQAVRSKRTP
jgi:hypothetical protein